MKSSVTSASSLIEMALSRGVDLGLTIRTFHNGVFSAARRDDHREGGFDLGKFGRNGRCLFAEISMAMAVRILR